MLCDIAFAPDLLGAIGLVQPTAALAGVDPVDAGLSNGFVNHQVPLVRICF
jgi:hypothetical protein